MNDSVSLVFPAYNEERNIPLLIEEIRSVVIPWLGDFEVIIVNDGSKDGTEDLLRDFSRQFPWLKTVTHIKNRGYGAAVKSGLLAAEKEFIFFSDADLQFDLRLLPCFLSYLEEYQAVLGYRAPRVDAWHRRLFGRMWSRMVSLLFDFSVKDVDCAFKAFRKEIKEIVKEISSEGATFSTELLVRMKDAHWRWIELPVRHRPRIEGEQTGARLKVILKAFKELYTFWKSYKNFGGSLYGRILER